MKIKKDNFFEEDKKLKYEDLLPLMYLQFKLEGFPKCHMIKHVIIDEAQDYSLLQIEMLKNIFINASFTILGDINQTINPYYKYSNLNQINKLFLGKARYIELLKTYRSSKEVIEFTNKILDISNVCAVRKKNSIPTELKEVKNKDIVDELINDINKMKLMGLKHIAIITKNKTESIDIYKKLRKENIGVTLLDCSNQKANGDLVILPSYISKGLEFDGVIAYTSILNLYNEKDKNLFYVVCSRAQHSLIVYNQTIQNLKK